MKGLKFLLAAASMALISLAHAGPIPALPLTPVVAGESTLTSFIVGAASVVHVDWMVYPNPSGPGYFYLYQLENPLGNSGVDTFSITFPAGASVGGVLNAGVTQGNNIDVTGPLNRPAHTPATFPNLAGENDTYNFQPLNSVDTDINPLDNTLTWHFDPLIGGSQSDTLFFFDLRPPTYGNAVSHDSTPPSPWGSLAQGGQPIPVPVPEPSSVAALITGASGLIALRLRRK